jgi:hypothetical protein
VTYRGPHRRIARRSAFNAVWAPTIPDECASSGEAASAMPGPDPDLPNCRRGFLKCRRVWTTASSRVVQA